MKDIHVKQLLENSSLATDQQFEDKLLDLIETELTPKKPTIWSLKSIIAGFVFITVFSTLGLYYILDKLEIQEMMNAGVRTDTVILIWIMILVWGFIMVTSVSSKAEKHLNAMRD